ncbi:helix-turn-helix protein [Flavobacterium sp. 9]|uniref:helix-turn-helix transcriptional regulator n=1 Tax=Flavobacterium sp. 9 TaxID=2035198 RepID=UPI000C17D1CD|nr:helix-turn-helix transcriptional regulator [Flavobacterium sp. 9]PIF34325.1 helix-turn-helix protein [Flavobacterium sp. 9]
MIKQKLIKKRIEKNIKQEEMAFHLGITQSQYSRRESGITKIKKSEWNILAKVLETNLETIYQSEDDVYFLDDNTNINRSNDFAPDNEYYDLTLAVMKKYIEKLENENMLLKMQLQSS